MSDSRNFMDLHRAQGANQRFLCIGLDPDVAKMPATLLRKFSENWRATSRFCHEIVVTTGHVAGAYKPNLAFFLDHGAEGLAELKDLIKYIHRSYPAVPVILDGKFGDIGNTAERYASFAFNYLQADAVTVNPYLGGDSLEPFTSYQDKGVFVLCRTSNQGGEDLQNMEVSLSTETMSLYQYVAMKVATEWNQYGNCGLVVGATYPDELGEVRQQVGTLPILIPGIGKQGGSLSRTIKNGRDKYGRGMIINVGSSILFASNGPDFAEAAGHEAEKYHAEILQHLNA